MFSTFCFLKIYIPKLNLQDFIHLGLSENDYMLCDGNLEHRQSGSENAEVFEKCKKVLEKLSTSENLLECSREILNKKDIEQIVESFRIIFSQMIKCKLSKSESFKNIYEKYSLEAISTITEKIDQAKQKIKFNCNSQAVLDCLLLAILEEKAKWAKKI